MKTVYPLQTKFAGGIIKYWIIATGHHMIEKMLKAMFSPKKKNSLQ